MPYFCLRTLKLVLQLGHFELSENLALPDSVADIHLDPAYVT